MKAAHTYEGCESIRPCSMIAVERRNLRYQHAMQAACYVIGVQLHGQVAIRNSEKARRRGPTHKSDIVNPTKNPPSVSPALNAMISPTRPSGNACPPRPVKPHTFRPGRREVVRGEPWRGPRAEWPRQEEKKPRQTLAPRALEERGHTPPPESGACASGGPYPAG